MATRRRRNTKSAVEEEVVTVTEHLEVAESPTEDVEPTVDAETPAEEPEVVAEEPKKEEKPAPVVNQGPIRPKKPQPARNRRNIPRFSAHK